MEQKDLFQLIPVFKRISDQQLTEYVCLYNLDTKQYAVLCSNFYHLPFPYSNLDYQQKISIELLLEESPQTRCEWFPSIKQAIHQHDLDFS